MSVGNIIAGTPTRDTWSCHRPASEIYLCEATNSLHVQQKDANMRAVIVEIIAPMLTAMEFGCSRCELVFSQVGAQQSYRRTCADEYPEEWKRDSERLAEMLARISELYKHRVRFRLIDAQSLPGLWKQIRHRIRKLPAFVVEKRDVCSALSLEKLEALIDRHIHDGR